MPAVVEYATPIAVVGGTRKGFRERASLSHSSYDIQEAERRGSRVAERNGLFANGYTTNPSGGSSIHVVNSHNQLYDMHLSPNSSGYGSSQMNGGRTTPTALSQRRSVHVAQPMQHSTPVNKIAVAPLPHRSEPQRTPHRCRDERKNSFSERRPSTSGANQPQHVVLPTYHAYPSTGKDVHFTREVLVDEPPSPPSSSAYTKERVVALEQKVRDLETAFGQGIQGSPVLSSRIPTHHLVFANTAPQMGETTQKVLERTIEDQKAEIKRQQTQLRKVFTQMEDQRARYDEEVREFKNSAKSAQEELLMYKRRLQDFEDRFDVYNDKLSAMDKVGQEDLVESRHTIRSLEDELDKVRTKSRRDFDRLQNELKASNEDRVFLEVQVENLNRTLDEKEEKIRQQEKELAAVRMEQSSYGQSCSSGSTPIVDELEAAADVSLRGGEGDVARRMYKKAHSTLGASMSPAPVQRTPLSGSSSGLRKSLSNYQLHEGGKGDITPAVSQLIRKQKKHLLDCRLLTRALNEIAQQVERGGTADLSSLLALHANAADSMSESEVETVAVDSTTMSSEDAQKKLEKHEQKLSGITRDLDELTRSLRTLYTRGVQRRLEREQREDEACRVQ